MSHQRKEPQKPKNDNFTRNILILLLFSFLLFGLLGVPKVPPQKKDEASYSKFLEEVEKGKIKEVVISDTSIVGKKADGKMIKVDYPRQDTELLNILKKEKVDIKVKPPPPWFMEHLSTILFIVIIIVFWLFIFRSAAQGGAGALSFGRSRAKKVSPDTQKTNFDDVAGCDEAKEELKEVVEFLKNPKKFQALGAKIPKGVLLLGPPGTGKTLLAKAVAGETGVPFFHMSGSDFVEMFVGVGAARVRDLFDQAKKTAPCLIFIDELDAVGRHRGAGLGGGHDEREQTLNQILVEMDGFDPNTGVILLAATNRPDILDPALLRPGRFDRHIVVDKPDVKGRKAILEIHSKGKPFEENVDMEVIARGTPGFSGADLANLINEGALLAARDGKAKIGMKDLEEAKEKVIAGPERKSRLISNKEKEVIAMHEAGHAVVAKLLPRTDPVHKISILPRGMALGYTMQLPTEDRYLISKLELLDHIAVMLGGRAAEEIIFSDITTGAHNDMERATETARRMVTEYGMSDKIGPLTLGKKHKQVFLGRDISEDRNYGEEVASIIDSEIKGIISECYRKAEKILMENKEKLQSIARVLIEKETLEGEELDKILNNYNEQNQNNGNNKCDG